MVGRSAESAVGVVMVSNSRDEERKGQQTQQAAQAATQANGLGTQNRAMAMGLTRKRPPEGGRDAASG